MTTLLMIILLLGLAGILVWGVVEFFKHRKASSHAERKALRNALEISESALRQIKSSSEDAAAVLTADIALQRINNYYDKELN